MKRIVNVFIITLCISTGFIFSSQNQQHRRRYTRRYSNKKVKILTINRASLKIRKSRNRIIFIANRHIRRTIYETYIFNYQEFMKKVGNPISITTVKVKVYITRKLEQKYMPANRRMQRPDDGFKIINYYCRIISKL